jgi:IS5 family transposase
MKVIRSGPGSIRNLNYELVELADKIDWDWIDSEIALLYSDKGRPGIATRFVIGLQAHLWVI